MGLETCEKGVHKLETAKIYVHMYMYWPFPGEASQTHRTHKFYNVRTIGKLSVLINKEKTSFVKITDQRYIWYWFHDFAKAV